MDLLAPGEGSPSTLTPSSSIGSPPSEDEEEEREMLAGGVLRITPSWPGTRFIVVLVFFGTMAAVAEVEVLSPISGPLVAASIAVLLLIRGACRLDCLSVVNAVILEDDDKGASLWPGAGPNGALRGRTLDLY